MSDQKKKLSVRNQAKTIPEITRDLKCRKLWHMCRDCSGLCEFPDSQDFEVLWVSVLLAEALEKRVEALEKKLSELREFWNSHSFIECDEDSEELRMFEAKLKEKVCLEK